MGISQELQELEQLLLTSTVRQNAQKIALLLADEFREFGSSGRVFSKAEIIDQLQTEPPVSLILNSFESFRLADHIFLTTFRVVKEVAGLPPSESLRSSIWAFRDGHWQMLFHQGTKIS